MSIPLKDKKLFEQEYDSVVKELLVLTSDMSGGASLLGDSWECIAFILAYIELDTGTLHIEEGRLTWLVSDQEREAHGIHWPYNFKTGCQYRVQVNALVSKTIPDGYLPSFGNRFKVCKVMEEQVSHAQLESVLKEYRKPVIIDIPALGTLTLDKDVSMFTGSIQWIDTTVNAYLEVDSGRSTTWTKAKNSLLKLHADCIQLDQNCRAFVADNLLESANAWQEMSELPLITQEELTERISLTGISVSSNGAYECFYADDDIFLGHSIRITGSLKKGISAADVVG